MRSSWIVAIGLSFALVACATGQGRKPKTREATLAGDILAATAETSGMTAAVTAVQDTFCRGKATKRALCHFRRAERRGWMSTEPSSAEPSPAAQETFDATASVPEPVVEHAEPSVPASPARPTAAARRMPAARPLALRGVNFGFDSARIEAQARDALDGAVAVLTEDPTGRVRIEGHADSVGSEDYNRTLSERRARTIAFYLAAHGVPRSRLHPVGLGEAHPLANNGTLRGRARNRRAELTILHQ
jgi:OOP family OmpA-OmpF porin